MQQREPPLIFKILIPNRSPFKGLIWANNMINRGGKLAKFWNELPHVGYHTQKGAEFRLGMWGWHIYNLFDLLRVWLDAVLSDYVTKEVNFFLE